MILIEFDIIRIGFVAYNGISIEILYLNCCRPNIDSCLFGINISKNFMYIDILFKTIKIFQRK